MTNGGLSDKVRRIAILVTSLDATAGRQLLSAMPTELARQVRRAMTQLGSIDPDEQRAILAEFRMQAMSASHAEPATARSTANSLEAAHSYSASDGSESSNSEVFNHNSPSPASHAAQHEGSAALTNEHRSASGDSQRPWQRLDVEALYELLRAERAPVIAVVLSQLDPQRAARLLEQLTVAQQREVIATLSRLGSIDPEAMAAIDEHLAGRIADYHHRRESESESLGRMQGLLLAASPDARGQWQSIIQETDLQLAQRMGLTAAPLARTSRANTTSTSPEPATAAAASSSAAPRKATSPHDSSAHLLELLSSNIVTTVDTHSVTAGPTKARSAKSGPAAPATIDQAVAASSDHEDAPTILPFRNQRESSQRASNPGRPAATESLMRFDDILELPAEQIGQVLASAPTEVILLALAGASPAFMKRFVAMLEKRDARALESRLREMRSINLQDVDEAQRRLATLATNLVRSGQIEPQVAAA